MPPKRKAASQQKGKPSKKSKSVKVVADKNENAQKRTTEKDTADVGKLIDLLKDKKWKEALLSEFDKDYFKELETTLAKEYEAGKEIFPPRDLIFNAFHLTPLDKVKVVILGQDPYHDNGQGSEMPHPVLTRDEVLERIMNDSDSGSDYQVSDEAMGLSFSVPKGIAIPGSLKNIYKELERDPKIAGFKAPEHGCLEKWAQNGVLMINATLTVEAHKANSHAKFGWQKFTDAVIKTISDKCAGVAFILWGGFAQKKEKLIDETKHAIVKRPILLRSRHTSLRIATVSQIVMRS